ncbi:MAG: hypothetical protein QM774_04015 [Gordonia sp. (in: high G+C Gram-positive bacteria)]|uniref:DUF7373 family lipoprotein n=1 Tax=Gordonia sp. (in: high G+C Gram-positive bacteria) TaxID=84139 RepID=UPI0039E45FF1
MTPTPTTAALTRTGAAALAITTSAVLLTGCTGGFGFGNKHKNASPSTAATASVDVSALDTGSYPTSPRPEFGKPDDDEIANVEGQRMAQFTLVPFEIDPDLTRVAMPNGVIGSQGATSAMFSKELREVPANAKIMTGFVATAATPQDQLRSGVDRSVNNAVLRYVTAEDATQAAQQMAQAGAAGDGASTVTLPGLPDTLAVQKVTGDDSSLMTFTPHDDYVLYQWYGTTKNEQDKQIPTLTKSIKAQADLIDKFPKTLTKAEAAEKGVTGSTRPEMDQNKILIYALPYSDQELKDGMANDSGASRAVYGPRGMAMRSTDPRGDYDLLTSVGAVNTAVDKSNVYRASTPEGAAKIVDSFVNDQKSSGASPIASPKGLSDAKCFKASGTMGSTYFYCLVQNGRYVGEVSAESEKDVDQRTSAQYVILTKADQSTPN